MADKKSFRKSQLIAFDNVAAGHEGVLSDPSGEIVVKPCKQSEIDFYESTSAHPNIIPYIPTYMGRIFLGSDTTVAQAVGTLVLPGEIIPDPPANSGIASAPLIENAWAPSNGAKIDTDLAIVLENVAMGYKKPNILDVKLGARLWADDAPVAKRVKLDKVAEESTSKPLGLRIAGMKTYQGMHVAHADDITADGYRVFGKMYGRGFNADTVANGFAEYFRVESDKKVKGPIRKVIKRFIADLQGLAEAFEKEDSRMYSASLLFVYEGDQQTLQEAFHSEKEILASLGELVLTDNDESLKSQDDDDRSDRTQWSKFPPIQSLKLIDFAHAEWTPGHGPDENLLHGIRNVIRLLDGLLG